MSLYSFCLGLRGRIFSKISLFCHKEAPLKYRIHNSRQKINQKSNIFFAIILLLSLLLIVRVGYISIAQYDEYQNKTLSQATTEQTVRAARGTIYDRNMNILAVSTTVERVFISPADIPQMSVREYIDDYIENMSATKSEKDEEYDRLISLYDNLSVSVAEDVANFLSEILEVEKSTILEKTAKIKRKDETIKQKVDQATCDKIREIIVAKHYTGFVHMQEDTKRSYPNGAVASHVIGFTGSDNNGLYGVEQYYDSYLAGKDGKIITAVNGVGEQMPYKYESYIPAEDGTNMMLTLDVTVQKILEKHLETALSDTQAEEGVWGIVMEVDTGEILAMAGLPDYDPNSPYTLDTASLAELDSFVGTDEERLKKNNELLYSMWKNNLITNTYEPGSTFKMITAAVAVEEKLVTETEHFNCSGSIRVEGNPKPINCHLRTGHGIQTFEESLWHSCNPVFVTMGLRIGTETFYKYYQAFGYLSKTGIDLPSERIGLWHSYFNRVELAVSSFGQTFTVTPIQHIAAVAAVANGGYLVTPHVMKGTVDDDGKVIENYKTDTKRQVISEETSDTIVGYMQGGVENGGSSRNAYVTGYAVAAKTGTSVKTDIRTQTGETKYIASCVAFAPADDPQIAVMVLIDEPVGTYYGGTIAAPVVSRVLSETLPYLGVETSYNENDEDLAEYPVGSYVGLPVSDAKASVIKDKYEYKVIGDGHTVIRQVPKAGEGLSHSSTVVLYTVEDASSSLVSVPNVVGMTATLANKTLTDHGLNVSIAGTSLEFLDGAISVSQSIEAGEVVDKGTVVEVEFRHFSNITD